MQGRAPQQGQEYDYPQHVERRLGGQKRGVDPIHGGASGSVPVGVEPLHHRKIDTAVLKEDTAGCDDDEADNSHGDEA